MWWVGGHRGSFWTRLSPGPTVRAGDLWDLQEQRYSGLVGARPGPKASILTCCLWNGIFPSAKRCPSLAQILLKAVEKLPQTPASRTTQWDH